jgi:hypothetical protein
MLAESEMADSGVFGMFGEAMEKFHRDDDEFALFFNAVGFWLNREIDEVNSQSGERSIKGVSRMALKGKAGVRKLLAEPTFQLTAGNERTGFVRLSLLTSLIEAEIEDTSPVQPGRPLSMKFRLKNLNQGGRAFRIQGDDRDSTGSELRAEQVAKVVVEAVIRGYFV